MRQGCPFSPLCFILILELLSARIRAEDNIKGLTFEKFGYYTEPIKMLQYCDDTTLLLESEKDLITAIPMIEGFYKISGLKLNRSKSMAITIGSLKDTSFTLGNLVWKKKGDTIKILGIHFCSTKEASDLDQNWLPKINKIRELSIKLQRRKTTL